MIKRCLKSWIFWLLMSILVLGVACYYESLSYYDEYLELLISTLFMVFNVICLINLSRKDGIRRLLTVTICSFSIFLFWNIGYREDIFYYEITDILANLSLLFVCMPAWTLTLLKLVWRDKSEEETKNDDKDKKLIKRTKENIKKK
jgi:hypothetical protein